jgi:hypothetical protein
MAKKRKAPLTEIEEAPKPTVYVHLNRALSHASNADQDFLCELLEDCATAHLELPIVALHHASRALKLGFSSETALTLASEFRVFSEAMAAGGWLRRFIVGVLNTASMQKAEEGTLLTPDGVLDLLTDDVQVFHDRLEGAKEIIKLYPEYLAEEIRHARQREVSK